MSATGDEQKGSGLGGMPAWPTEAKELPGSQPIEPPRNRLAWSLGPGVFGATVSFFRNFGEGLPFAAGAALSGFAILALLGLVIEYSLYARERGRRERMEREDR